VGRAARSHHFYFLGQMEQALAKAHLQLCDRENDRRPGINFVGLRSVGGIAEQRFNPSNWYHNSLHPNQRGHAAMLQVFEQWLVDNPERKGPGEPVRKAKAEGPVAAEERLDPPCDLVKDDLGITANCREEGAAWAKGQISDTILLRWWGLRIAVAALAAWLLGVALFGWWKPWWPERPRG
jgi:hypothetical protein